MLTRGWTPKSTYSGWGIDVACVVSYLEGAEHRCHDGDQQRNSQLILNVNMGCCKSTLQCKKVNWCIACDILSIPFNCLEGFFFF